MTDTPPIDYVDAYIGERLRQQRKKLRLSQSALGAMVGISYQQVQKHESGMNKISAKRLYSLSRALNIPVSYFYEGMQPPDEQCGAAIAREHLVFSRQNPLSVLLVEDNPGDEILTRHAIERCGMETRIHCVRDGVAALQFLRNKRQLNHFPRPDIILLDLNVPKKDGLSVLKDIKRDSDLQDIPVIILTNSIHVKDMIEGYRMQACGFVSKSFDIKEFNDNIGRVIDYWSRAVVLPSM